MNITINARRVTITDSFKARVEKKLKKLDRFFDHRIPGEGQRDGGSYHSGSLYGVPGGGNDP